MVYVDIYISKFSFFVHICVYIHMQPSMLLLVPLRSTAEDDAR